MDYRPLGNIGLTISVAGLGCGGNGRLGSARAAAVITKSPRIPPHL